MADPFHAFIQYLTVAMTGTTHKAVVIGLPRRQVEGQLEARPADLNGKRLRRAFKRGVDKPQAVPFPATRTR